MDRVCNAWVRRLSELVDFPGPIVEFGSLWRLSYVASDGTNVYDLRPLFPGKEYVGCDLRRGHGVDRVEDMARTTLDTASVGTILCLNVIEHVRDPIRAVEECRRILRPGGLIVLQSLFHFHLHGLPRDYWRFTRECFRDVLLAPFAASTTEAVGPEALAPKWISGVAQVAPADGVINRVEGQFGAVWEEMGKPNR